MTPPNCLVTILLMLTVLLPAMDNPFFNVFTAPLAVAPTLGAATLSGKLALAASASNALDLLDTFSSVGDPATKLNLTLVPWATNGYLPITQR